MKFFDSAGKSLFTGDRVRFRGQVYTIKLFLIGQGRRGSAGIVFLEPQHVDEMADEFSVDLIAQPLDTEAETVVK